MSISLLWILLISHSLWAYDVLLQAENEQDLLFRQTQYQQNEVNRESCRIRKEANLFQWPCFIVEKAQWSTGAKNEHCALFVPKTNIKKHLPANRLQSLFTGDCWAIISHRKRILDYKAKAP